MTPPSLEARSGLRLALLTNFIPPYRLPLFLQLARHTSAFRVMISTTMEADRFWNPEFGGLDVCVQRTFTLHSVRKHPSGFRDTGYVHFPYDTIPRLIGFHPDIVISDQFGFRTLNALLYRLLFRRCRLLVWATISEATESGRSPTRLLLRHLIVRFADAIVTSARSGSRYLERFHAAPEKVFTIPQTADVAGFACVPLLRDASAGHRLLYVGRLIELKQVAPFTSILSEWCLAHPERPVEFWIAGDGPERAAIESLPLAPNLSLRLLGNIPYAELPEIYGRAGVLVLPSMADEWGLVVNEAMAAGLPVLGSVYSQAVQEMVEDGRTGWAYRIDHRDEVLQAVGRFFAASEAELERMRSAARETALSLTPQAVADRMMEAIRFAIHGSA
jgi:glycosyltransferase involved in cell wall biosynthesis